MRVFLDLEDTVIDTWGSGAPVNTKEVKHFLEMNNVSKVDIFSFAIWDLEHTKEFNARLRNDLESTLEVTVDQVVDCTLMMAVDFRFTRVRFESLMEFISLRGKNDAFVNWALCKHQGEHSVLLDDIVPNRTTKDHDTDTLVETVNVTTLWKRLPKG